MNNAEARLADIVIGLKAIPGTEKFFLMHEDGSRSAKLKHSLRAYHVLGHLSKRIPIIEVMERQLPPYFTNLRLDVVVCARARHEQFMPFINIAVAHFKENKDDYAVSEIIGV